MSAVEKRKAASPDDGAIPIVDISALLRRDDARAMRRTLCRIRTAVQETGVFYLAGHAVPLALLHRVYLRSLAHFEFLPEFKIGLSADEGMIHYIAGRRSVFEATHAGRAQDAPTMALVERYYECIFDLCRSLLQGCALALDGPFDLFHHLMAHPVLHARLLKYPALGDIHNMEPPGANQPYGAVAILWADDVDCTHVDDTAPPTVSTSLESGTFAFRIGDTMARLSADLHISAPHCLTDGWGRKTYLIPVLHGGENNIPDELATRCFLTKQPEQPASPL